MMDGTKAASTRDNQRQCKHNHGRSRKVSVEEFPAAPVAPSPIREETDVEIANVLKLDEERPWTSGSDNKSRQSSVSPGRKPESRATSRASGARSTFENVPGTRPASRRVRLLVC